MEIKQVDASRKEIFNRFIAENSGSFLQSFEWGEFQEKSGKKIRRFLIQEDGEILAAAALILYSLPFKKSYLYCGRGPVIGASASNAVAVATALLKSDEVFKLFFEETKEIAEKENAIFFKIESDTDFPVPSSELSKFGFKKSPKEIQPSETLILDLRKTEKELLKEMKQKTRYNIGVAEKHGIKIEEDGDFEKFWPLMEETASRDKFHLHPKKYYETILHSNAVATATALLNWNKLFLAEKDGKILAGAIVNFFGKRATYLHGASSAEHKNLMAPHLLHWEIVRYAKKNGFEKYDLWGISEKKYPGVTRFKRGFGGKEINYPGAYDFIFDKKWHLIYSAARKIF